MRRCATRSKAVSYTHLDVYKRQVYTSPHAGLAKSPKPIDQRSGQLVHASAGVAGGVTYVYATTSKGELFVSEDSGLTWQTRTPSLGQQSGDFAAIAADVYKRQLLNGGQARIGLDPDGQAASRVKPAADGNGKFNANTAVCAHSVCPGLGHRRSNGLGRGAHHGAVLVFAGVEGEGDKDGQSGGQCRINGEAGLVDFAHGLDEQGIRSLSLIHI